MTSLSNRSVHTVGVVEKTDIFHKQLLYIPTCTYKLILKYNGCILIKWLKKLLLLLILLLLLLLLF